MTTGHILADLILSALVVLGTLPVAGAVLAATRAVRADHPAEAECRRRHPSSWE